MKTKTFLIAAVLLLTFSAAAFAQATFTVGSIPVTAVANNGQTEKTGSITFTTIPGSAAVIAGTVTISYGVPITVPAASISIAQAPAGVFTILAVNNAAGQLVLSVGASPGAVTATISGVRVATAGSTLTSLNASVSTTGNALVAGQTSVQVINSITAPIATVALPPLTAPTPINAVVGAPFVAPGPGGVTANLVITEGFLNAFGVMPLTDPTQSNGNRIKITVDAPPAGLNLSFPMATTATSGTWVLSDSAGVAALAAQVISSTSTSFDVYYSLTVDTSPTAIDSVTIPVTAVNAAGATFPLAAATIKASATMAPIGTAFGPFGAVLLPPPAGTASIPRYAASLVGPATLFIINPGTTTLLIPFGSTLAGYDTGIAIVNTTNDPGVINTGLASAAVAQNGTIKFFFYPGGSGTPFTYTTSASSPGTGLTAGALPAGKTYSVLLSELLNAAGAPALFSGHIFAVASFTNAHVQYFVTDFKAFTNGAVGLVVAGGRAATPESLGQ
jgi:hypothetical protein